MSKHPTRAKTFKATQIYWMLSRAGLTAARNGDGPLSAQITNLLIQLGFDQNWPGPLYDAIASSIKTISNLCPHAAALTLNACEKINPEQFPVETHS